MEDVDTFYGQLVNFTAIWYSLWPFGFLWPFSKFNGHLVYFLCFGMLYQEKSGSPDCKSSFVALVTSA
jgi:hypothetical protein